MEQTTAEVVAGARLAEDAGLALGEIEKVSNDLADPDSEHLRGGTAAVGRRHEHLGHDERDSGNHHADPLGASQTAESIGNLAQLANDLRRSVADFKPPTRSAAQGGAPVLHGPSPWQLVGARVHAGHGRRRVRRAGRPCSRSARASLCPPHARPSSSPACAGACARPHLSFEDHYRHLQGRRRGRHRVTTLVDRLTVHETHFFRHAPLVRAHRAGVVAQGGRRRGGRRCMHGAWAVPPARRPTPWRWCWTATRRRGWQPYVLLASPSHRREPAGSWPWARRPVIRAASWRKFRGPCASAMST